MLKNKLIKLSAVCVLAASSSIAMAHINIAQENVFALGDGPREYKDGSRAFLSVNVAHDCKNAAGEHFPTTGVALLLPNGKIFLVHIQLITVVMFMVRMPLWVLSNVQVEFLRRLKLLKVLWMHFIAME